MGRVVSKSAQSNKSQNLIMSATGRQQKVYDVMASLEAFASDSILSGESYENAKGFVSSIYLPVTKALCMALEDEITANRNVIDCCNSYLQGTDLFDEDTIRAEISRLQKEIYELQDDWWDCLPFVREVNMARILYKLSQIQELNGYLQELDSFDSATQGLHSSASTQMNLVNQKIAFIFSPSLYSNGRYNYAGIDMRWADELMKRWNDYNAVISSKLRCFSLPAEQRQEIENILNSNEDWEEKAEQIRQVYERYLFESIKDRDGNNPFLKYAEVLKMNNGDTNSQGALDADNQLGIILKNSGIDIRAVTRGLCEDLLKAMPQNVDAASRMLNFINLVNTGAPADLKTNALGNALNGNYSENYSFDYSIWSRKWEPDMTPDYLGNYGFGYIGAEYWKGVDFDGILASVSQVRAIVPSMGNESLLAGVELYATGMIPISALRAANPDKTDAEMFCRIGAGVAQLQSDSFDVIKYADSVLKGGWGDNVNGDDSLMDSDMIGQGFKDYYHVHGIIEEQVIREERKLW